MSAHAKKIILVGAGCFSPPTIMHLRMVSDMPDPDENSNTQINALFPSSLKWAGITCTHWAPPMRTAS